MSSDALIPPTAIDTDDLRAVMMADAGAGIDPTVTGGGITAAQANTALSAGGSNPITDLEAGTTLDGETIATGVVAGALRLLGPFPFAFDTPNLSNGTGAAIYTPVVGTVLFEAFVQVDTAFNGTTPLVGLGDAASDLMDVQASGGFGVDALDTDTGLVRYATGTSSLAAKAGANNALLPPLMFTGTGPLLVWCTQDGRRAGFDPVNTAGAADLYLVIATPSLT